MRLLLVIIFCAFSFLSEASVFSIDSVGSEEKGGKLFILHEVVVNETLYSLSRRYDVPIYEIIENNPPTEYGLDEGQVIRIPVKNKKLEQVPERVIASSEKNEVVLLSDSEVTRESPEIIESKESSGNSPIHEVKEKETLFSISRIYKVSVTDIKKWNNLTSNSLDIGQKLIIGQSSNEKEQLNLKEGVKTHEVQASETLYSISRKYAASINDIKSWNDLGSNELSIGQVLIVAERPKGENVVLPTKNSNDTTKPKITSVIKEPTAIDTARYNIQPEERTNFKEIIEDGLAEQISGSENNRKYLALHKTAKTGTLIRVKNEMNNQEIFVRVIGPLPNTSDYKNHVIKVSKAAYDRLGAIDPKFRVTVSYIP